ncbi:MAG: hypothetical protein K0Q71_2515 [Thermomicrobiales bacterium]|nr:hypothetical protein [Thermomicrobiales bacterium]
MFLLFDGCAAANAASQRREAARFRPACRNRYSQKATEGIGGLDMTDARRLSAAATVLAVLSLSAAVAAGQASSQNQGDRAASAALTQVGNRYTWGGAAPRTGFDSSGLVVWAYAKAGRANLPHHTATLWSLGRHVSRKQLKRGDLVFFDGMWHVGIYLGGNRFVHSPPSSAGAGVRVQSLDTRVYGQRFVGAVRLRG